MNNSKQFNELKLEEKRAHHNRLERRRRINIKESYKCLSKSIPCLSDVPNPSCVLILKETSTYLTSMKSKTNALKTNINDLKRQNLILEEQIKILEKVKADLHAKESTSDVSGSLNAGTLDSE